MWTWVNKRPTADSRVQQVKTLHGVLRCGEAATSAVGVLPLPSSHQPCLMMELSFIWTEICFILHLLHSSLLPVVLHQSSSLFQNACWFWTACFLSFLSSFYTYTLFANEPLLQLVGVLSPSGLRNAGCVCLQAIIWHNGSFCSHYNTNIVQLSHLPAVFLIHD